MNNNNIKKNLYLGWFICGLGALFYCYEYLLRIEPSAMAHQLINHFGITATMFGILSACYYAAYTPMQLIVGILHDRYGPRRILTVAVLFCTLGSFMFGMTHSLYIAAIGRFLIGFGSAFAFVGVMKLAAVWLPNERFAMFAGLVTALGMVGGITGDIGMAFSVQGIGWQHTILIGSIIGVILSPIMWISIRDKNPLNQNQINSSKLSLKETLLGVGKIIINWHIWLAGIIGAILYLSLSVLADNWGPLFLQKVHQVSAEDSLHINTAIYFGWLIGGPLAGWISDRIRNRRLPLITGSFVSAFIIIIITYVPVLPIPLLYALLFLFGIFSSVQVICFAIGFENSPNHLAASAIACINTIVMLGAIIFQPLFGFLLDFFWQGEMHNGTRFYSVTDYQLAMTLFPIMLFLCGILCVWVKKEYAHKPAELNSLRWKCRRGMLELDNLLLNFVDNHFSQASTQEQQAFIALLEYNDQQLWNWFILNEDAQKPEIAAIIKMVRINLERKF